MFTEIEIERRDFIYEYAGDLISYTEAEAREKSYTKSKPGSILYFFGRYWWINLGSFS